MKLKKVKVLTLSLLLALLIGLMGGCGSDDGQQDIVVLYTGDVYCAVDENIGYAGLAAYKKQVEEETPYVALVDCGDALQGDAIGTISQGEYLVDIMNKVGYDFAVLGNHEFDYGMERLAELMEMSDAAYLGCNVDYTGSGENALSALQQYEIVDYGDTKVAFIGISAPESISQSTPAYFMDENGDIVYSFCSDSGEALYSRVQETVDSCREEGADYVIALTHLGDDESSAPFRSTDLIAGTSGIDAVLDSDTHSAIDSDMVENEEGREIPLSSSGTGLENIGQLTITPEGDITTRLISDFEEKDSDMESFIADIQSEYEEELQQVIAGSDVELTTESEDGVRLIRNRETNLGDFCADAYRQIAGADIAFVNGGGIRADLSEGDITYEDILAVHPYGNHLCVVEATGQEILDALEMGSCSTMAETGDGEKAAGESGGFLQVSGLRYTIDTSVDSTVKVDKDGMFVSCGQQRRVKNVEVLQDDGSYEPIDVDETYTLASHDYMLRQSGDGFTMFADNEMVVEEGMVDYQILITYISDYLGGSIGEQYSSPDGRITVE